MLRDQNLVPLSRQHQHALALCVRIDRAVTAGELNMASWQAEVHDIFLAEIQAHFQAEESLLFPAARQFPELATLVDELIDEHALLRNYFTMAARRELDAANLHALARQLSAHIRKEERQLFEKMQKLMNRQELSSVGAALEKALATLQAACRLRSRPPAYDAGPKFPS